MKTSVLTSVIAALFILTSVGAQAAPFRDLEIRAEKELLITDMSVVENERAKGVGPWSFGGMMKELASDRVSPNDLVRSWLHQLETVTQLNGFPVEPRRIARYLSMWPRPARETLDPASSPFRLLAVIYRPDISNREAPNGEARFVYSGIRSDDNAGIPFLVILEFKIPSNPRAWAMAFHRLGSIPFGEEYNQALEAVTRPLFVRSNFLQLRTNDFFGTSVWEYRQFQLDQSGLFAQTPLTNTPDISFNSIEWQNPLVEWAEANERSIMNGTAEIPQIMLAGASPAPADSFRWLTQFETRLGPNVRHQLSKTTCNGCHSGETRTVFAHIGPRGSRHSAPLSPFLRGELPMRSQALNDRMAGQSFRSMPVRNHH